MKGFLPVFLLLGLHFESRATDYFSQGSVSPNILTNWNTIPAGGGATPTDFVTAADRFIIQAGHFMTTTGVWTIGGAGSILEIRAAGTLQGDHTIILTGTFQINNLGTYIHNNTGSVAQPANSSIFSGAESFAVNSNFEIRNWIDNITGLPNTTPGIIWGNLIVNLQVDLGTWNWNFASGQTLTINGNLDIRSTYITTPAELRLTPTGIHNINVGGNFLISGTSQVGMKKNSSPPLDDYTTMQVNGNVSLTGTAQLDLGVTTTSAATVVGLYDLRFRGNFSAAASTTVTSSSSTPYLVANGVAAQSINCLPTMNCNFRVAAGATVNLTAALTMASSRFLVALGTFNQNSSSIIANGPVEAAGGVFNFNTFVNFGSACRACTSDGTYNNPFVTWCTATGTKGRANFNSSTITLNLTTSTTHIIAGALTLNSPGDVYFTNNSTSTNSGVTFPGAYIVMSGSVFSLDATSHVRGINTSYYGRGGTLRIGSADGITPAGNIATGNVRVSDNKLYDDSGINSFEYFGTAPQVTGTGLPVTVDGSLIINNTAGIGTSGVTLSQNTTVSGVLNLTSGKLTTTISELMNLTDNATAINYSNNSFVSGPMTKTGDETFTFPVGEGAEIHTITLHQISGDDVTDRFQIQYHKANPQVLFPGTFGPGIQHMSALEYWMVNKMVGDPINLVKKIELQATTYSDATDLSSLVITHNTTLAVWENDGNSAFVGLATGLVTSQDVSTYGPFTFASNALFPANPLPIDLVLFDASKISTTKALINWELAACCSSSALFEIQRAGIDRRFTTIGNLGGSETNRFYNYTDNGLKAGINYYRLKMIDADGKISYSRTVAIMNGVDGLLLTSLVPTVINNTTVLTITSSTRQKLDIIIVDMQGRVVNKQNRQVDAGNTSIEISIASLAAGAYQLFGIATGGKTNAIRFIKQ